MRCIAPAPALVSLAILLSGCGKTDTPPMEPLPAGPVSTTAAGDGSESFGVAPRTKQPPSGMLVVEVPSAVVEKAAEFSIPRKLASYTLKETPTPARPKRPQGVGMRVDVDDLEAAGYRPPDGEAPLASEGATFESNTFDDSIADTGGGVFIPPDPHAAAGPSHVMNVTNVMMSVHQKNGTLALRDSLDGFESGDVLAWSSSVP